MSFIPTSRYLIGQTKCYTLSTTVIGPCTTAPGCSSFGYGDKSRGEVTGINWNPSAGTETCRPCFGNGQRSEVSQRKPVDTQRLKQASAAVFLSTSSRPLTAAETSGHNDGRPCQTSPCLPCLRWSTRMRQTFSQTAKQRAICLKYLQKYFQSPFFSVVALRGYLICFLLFIVLPVRENKTKTSLGLFSKLSNMFVGFGI